MMLSIVHQMQNSFRFRQATAHFNLTINYFVKIDKNAIILKAIIVNFEYSLDTTRCVRLTYDSVVHFVFHARCHQKLLREVSKNTI